MPTYNQLMPDQAKELADKLYEFIAHGDDEHRRWLREKVYEFFKLCPPSTK